MPTTTNFGWTTPADTDLVKDGANAIRTLGNGIDTSFLDLKGGTTGQFLKKNSNTDLDFVWGDSGGLTLISTTTLSGSSISLTSIPQTYKDIRILIKNYLPATDDTKIQLRFNNISTNSYSGLMTTLNSESSFGSSLIDLVRGQDNAVATGGLIDVRIPDYTNSTTWKWLITSGTSNWSVTSSTVVTTFGFGVHNNTDAITRIDLIQSSGNFTSGTVLLYGVN